MSTVGPRSGRWLCAALVIVGAATVVPPARAQTLEQDPAPLNDGAPGTLIMRDPPPAELRGPLVTTAPGGAALRWLDKMSGQVADLVLDTGGSGQAGNLTVTLRECRYPVQDPASNAYAFLVIQDKRAAAPLFDGWMIADSPALSALDHPRYDVWLLRCVTTSDGDATKP